MQDNEILKLSVRKSLGSVPNFFSALTMTLDGCMKYNPQPYNKHYLYDIPKIAPNSDKELYWPIRAVGATRGHVIISSETFEIIKCIIYPDSYDIYRNEIVIDELEKYIGVQSEYLNPEVLLKVLDLLK